MKKFKTLAIIVLSFCVVQNALAATVNFTGWETGDCFIEGIACTGTSSVTSTSPRTGTYALRVNPTTTGTGYNTISALAANGTNDAGSTTFSSAYIAFHLYVATAPASNDEQIVVAWASTGTTVKWSLRLNSDRTIDVYDSVPTLIGTSSTAIAASSWTDLIEVKATTSAVAATLELKINGNVEVTTSLANTTATAHGQINFGKVTDINGQTIDVRYDDIRISDSAYPGEGSVKVLLPTANGSTMQWTSGTGASDYTTVDEVPTSTGDYVMSTGGAGEVSLFDLTDTTGVISGTINSVKAVTRTRENTSVTSSTSVRIRGGDSTNSDSSGINGDTNARTQSRIRDTDPATSSAWTLSGLDLVEVGNVEANAVSTRNAWAAAMVDYTPGASAISTIKGLADASVKTVNGLARASVKTINGLA